MNPINLNLMCHQIYHNIDFSLLPDLTANLPPFQDYTGSAMQPEVSLTL